MVRPLPSSVLVSVLAALLLVTAVAPAAVPGVGLAAAAGLVVTVVAPYRAAGRRCGRHLAVPAVAR